MILHSIRNRRTLVGRKPGSAWWLPAAIGRSLPLIPPQQEDQRAEASEDEE